MLQKAMTENEMLRATSGSRRPAPFLFFPDDGTQSPDANNDGKEDEGDFMVVDRVNNLRRKGKTLFTQTAVWDFLIDHPLIKEGYVDIQDAWDRVKNTAKNGMDGPVYVEGDVRKAIDGSRKGGGDALV
jgi:hypothetical protein